MTAYAASKPGYQAGLFVIAQKACKGLNMLILGLHLILNAMQAEYSDWLSLVGMRVIIHKSSDTVFPDSNGYDLPPGYDTSFSVRKVNQLTKRINLILNFYGS